MHRTLLLSLVVPAAAACTEPMQITEDTPIGVATSGDRVLVAATEETENTGFGCGGGGGNYGPSVLFVSGDRGTSFERVVPADSRALTRIASRGGMFYAIAEDLEGGFGVMSSPDGATWTEVAHGDRYASALAVSPSAIVVAHNAGVLISTDGVTFVDRPISDNFAWNASVAHLDGTIVLGTGADGVLKLSTDGGAWRTHRVPGFDSVFQLIAAGDSLLVSGYANNTTAIARLDLANLTAPPVVRYGFANTSVLTPAGLLETGGRLAPFDANGVGEPVDHLSPFNAAAVNANEVVLLRNRQIETSTDGGLTFGGAIELPIVTTETPADI